MGENDDLKVCVVGSGTRFLSGISYYTHHLAGAISERAPVCVVLMRNLIPRALYPGRARVGHALADLEYPSRIRIFDGVDWYWIPSIFDAVRFLRREHPTHVVFQWWTGAVLHSFLALALVCRALNAQIIVEFHEIQDPGESTLAPARLYVRLFAGLLMRLANGFVIHSESDRELIQARYRLHGRPMQTILHGPYDHHDVEKAPARRCAPDGVTNFLFFGTIRPYKGVEDLIEAFESLCARFGPELYWLTVVGETWEGWTLPARRIQESDYRARITFVNRYVTDAEAAGWFAGADAVVLPYRRSSASGPLHLSMSAGLPTVVTRVGGLPEAVAGYEGAIMTEEANPAALAGAMVEAVRLRGQRFSDPHSWDRSAELMLALAKRLRHA